MIYTLTKGVSCNITAILLTESVCHCIDTKVPIYITYRDASKVFDVMDRDSTLVHLFKQGIHGKLRSCYNNLYTSITSHMKWKSYIAIAFKEEQCIQNDGVSSTAIFKAKGNHPCLD